MSKQRPVGIRKFRESGLEVTEGDLKDPLDHWIRSLRRSKFNLPSETRVIGRTVDAAAVSGAGG